MKSPPPPGPWDWFEPEEDRWYRWKLDGAEVGITVAGNRWQWWSCARKPGQIRRDFGGPWSSAESPTRQLHTVISRREPIALRPMIINKPFVIRYPEAMPIHRGETVPLAVDLPVSYHWTNREGETLALPQTILLPKTWFGDASSGTSCFLWEVDFETALAPPYGSLVRCQILIRNVSRTTLSLRQFAVHTELLGLWYRDGFLITDTVVVEGLPDGDLRMSTLNNDQARGGQNLHDPWKGHKEWQVQRGVEFLKNIAGIT